MNRNLCFRSSAEIAAVPLLVLGSCLSGFEAAAQTLKAPVVNSGFSIPGVDSDALDQPKGMDLAVPEPGLSTSLDASTRLSDKTLHSTRAFERRFAPALESSSRLGEMSIGSVHGLGASLEGALTRSGASNGSGNVSVEVRPELGEERGLFAAQDPDGKPAEGSSARRRWIAPADQRPSPALTAPAVRLSFLNRFINHPFVQRLLAKARSAIQTLLRRTKEDGPTLPPAAAAAAAPAETAEAAEAARETVRMQRPNRDTVTLAAYMSGQNAAPTQQLPVYPAAHAGTQEMPAYVPPSPDPAWLNRGRRTMMGGTYTPGQSPDWLQPRRSTVEDPRAALAAHLTRLQSLAPSVTTTVEWSPSSGRVERIVVHFHDPKEIESAVLKGELAPVQIGGALVRIKPVLDR